MRRRWLWWLLVGGFVLAYIAGSAASALVLTTHTDLDISFWPSAMVAAHGHPLLVYSVAGQSPYPNANGPLSLVPLSAVALLADKLGWAGSQLPRTALTLGVFSVFSLLLALEAMRLIVMVHGEPVPRIRRRVGAAAILLGPPIWLAVTGFGHIELPVELWLTLLGVRQVLSGRPGWGGIALGLAALSRTTALLYLIPVGVFLLTTRKRHSAGVAAYATSFTLAAGVAAFYFADPTNVVHSLFTYRDSLPINGGSVWYLLRNDPAAGIIQHGDIFITAAVVAALCLLLQWLRSRDRASDTRLIAMLAVTAACFPMLAKTTLAYYLLEPYVFAVVWWLARPGPVAHWRVVVPLLVLAATGVADIGVDLPRVVSLPVQGAILSGLLALVVLLVFVLSSPPRERSASTGADGSNEGVSGAGADGQRAVVARPVIGAREEAGA
jgi:hypothetical protein